MATTSKKPTTKPKRNDSIVGKFFVTPVTIEGKYITIKLPKKVATYLELEGGEIHWSAVNGVVQLSGNRPDIAIPMMGVNVDAFVPQES
jgi:hypothetical protein